VVRELQFVAIGSAQPDQLNVVPDLAFHQPPVTGHQSLVTTHNSQFSNFSAH